MLTKFQRLLEKIRRLICNQKFLLYYVSFFINEKVYILRFPVPQGWASAPTDKDNAHFLGLISTHGEDWNVADAFISIKLSLTDLSQDYGAIETILNKFEENFIHAGWTKDTKLSAFKTYDQRMISVLTLENTQIDFIRKEVILPLKEDLTVMLSIGFQVNHCEKKYREFFFPIFEAIIQSLKIQEAAEDQEDKIQYAKNISQIVKIF